MSYVKKIAEFLEISKNISLAVLLYIKT